MAQPNRQKWHGPAASDFLSLLEILLAFDRTVVELSMHAYNLPRRQRFAMRKQNRRLHDAVRERLPQLLEPS
jgi:hypothetical protein